jgi:hypothetical protein
MKEKSNWKKSKFTKLIRIRKSQYEFIEKIRGIYSRAGMLDKIINEYKKNLGGLDK